MGEGDLFKILILILCGRGGPVQDISNTVRGKEGGNLFKIFLILYFTYGGMEGEKRVADAGVGGWTIYFCQIYRLYATSVSVSGNTVTSNMPLPSVIL